MSFDPNQLTYDDGLKRIAKAVKAAGLDTKKIVTSRDSAATVADDALRVTNVPAGTTKYQLPIALSRAQLFISIIEPGTNIPEHSHDEGAGVRFIASGSISYGGHDLHAGDWMYIPAGMKYSFKVGKQGATMFYCYECCCAGPAN